MESKIVTNNVLIKIVVTLLILGLGVTFIDYELVIDALLTADVKYILLAIFLQIPLFVLNTIRWKMLLNFDGFIDSFSKLFKITLISNFANNFLPSSVGGDALRLAYVYKKKYKIISTSSILFERLIGLLVMLLIGGTALYLYQNEESLLNSIQYVLNALFFALAVLLLIISKANVSNLITVLKSKIHSNKWSDAICNVLLKLGLYVKSARLTAIVICFTILSQLIGIFIYWAIGESMNINAPIIIYFIIIPISLVISSIPISFGGLGLREVTSVTMFIILGVNEIQAVNVSLIYLLVLIVSSAPGMIYYFLYGNKLGK